MRLVHGIRLRPYRRTNKLKVLKPLQVWQNQFEQILFRLCWELKIINQDKYISFEKDILEMGRMTGGWIKKPNAPQNEALG